MFNQTSKLASAFVTGVAAGVAAAWYWWRPRNRKCVPCECAVRDQPRGDDVEPEQ